MSHQIHVGLVGYGYAGRTLHAPLIRSVPGLALTAVVSSQMQDVHRDLPDVAVLASADEAFSDPSIDLIVIATPNATHARLAEAALRARKHVVVDKPIALNLAEARHLASLAERCGRVLSVFQNRRWDSDFLGLHDVLRTGRIGRPIHLESRFDRFRKEPRDRWRERAEEGGGIRLDLGPHLVDQILLQFGLPQRVGGLVAGLRSGARADDWCQMQLDYGRLQVTLSASMLVGGGLPRFAAHGTRGSWLKHGLDPQEAQLQVGLAPGGAGWGRDPRPGVLHRGEEVEYVPVPAGDYRLYYQALRDAVLGTGSNPVSAGEAVATMAVLEAVQLASRTGCMQQLALSEAERQAFESLYPNSF